MPATEVRSLTNALLEYKTNVETKAPWSNIWWLKKVVSRKTKPRVFRVFSLELLVVNEKWSLLRLIDPSYPNRI